MPEGNCPKCGSCALDYGTQVDGVGGDELYYPFTCEDCGFKGKEWYEATITGYTDEDDRPVKK